MTLQTDTPDAIHSSFALQQLTRFAHDAEQIVFVHMLMSVFGTDIPGTAYVRLHEALRAGTLAPPAHHLDHTAEGLAFFSETTQSIAISPQAVEQALREPVASLNLFNQLLQAFGAYLNNWLHQGTTGSTENAKIIGIAYAAMITFCSPRIPDGTIFARCSTAKLQEELVFAVPKLDFELPPTPMKWKAGRGDNSSYTHGAIERGLATLGFTDSELRGIYFGNWLRDYSQLLDPKIVRMTSDPKVFPKLPREVLTRIVDLLALDEFHDLQSTPEGRQTYRVTPEVAGVYRPSEHIDNPLIADDAEDPREIDTDFEPAVRDGDASLAVDTERSMSRYIDNSVEYMYRKLVDAMNAGNTPTGRRYFGEALHVLEDYFAHSNFVELCLHQRNHKDVLPWTLQRGKHGFAITTGMFGGLDVIASIAEPLGKLLFSVEDIDFTLIKPGERSDAEEVLLILLEEYDATAALELINTYLAFRDEAAANPAFSLYQAGAWVTNLPVTLFKNAINGVMRQLLGWIADNIAHLQTLSGHNPNQVAGLHPTHSQLAKDHDSHPLHELSGLMTTYAVQEVGRSLYAYWQGDTTRDAATKAKSFIVHPGQDDWHQEIVAAWEALRGEQALSHIRKASNYSDMQALQASISNEKLERARARIKDYDALPTSITDIVGTIGFGFG